MLFNDDLVAELKVLSDEIAMAKQDLQTTGGCEISIRTQSCPVVFSRLALSRDIYYRGEAKVYFDAKYGMTGSPIRLDPNQFFMLGDNSEFSQDSRFWGPVPRELLTGVARWRYWPISRWHRFQ